MEIKIAQSPIEFLNEFEDKLMEEEAKNQLFLGNLYAYKDKSFETDNIFGSITENGKLLLIFLNAYPFNLQLLGFHNTFEANHLLVKYIYDYHINIRGINGTKSDCDLFIEAYQECFKQDFYLFTPMDIMVADHVENIELNNEGQSKIASYEDIDQIAVLFNEFAIEAVNEHHPYEKIRNAIKNRIDNSNQFIYVVDQKIVAIAHIGKRTKNSNVISGVYTDPSFRGRGYCTALIHHMTKQCLINGVIFCTLFVNKINPISNRVYNKVGFISMYENLDYRIKNLT